MNGDSTGYNSRKRRVHPPVLMDTILNDLICIQDVLPTATMAFILELFFKQAEEEDAKRANKEGGDMVDVNSVTLSKNIENVANIAKGIKTFLPDKKP